MNETAEIQKTSPRNVPRGEPVEALKMGLDNRMWRTALAAALLLVGCDDERLCARGACEPNKRDAGVNSKDNTHTSSSEESASSSQDTSEESTRDATNVSSAARATDSSGCERGEACHETTPLCKGNDQDALECVRCEPETNRGCGASRPHCVVIGGAKQSDRSDGPGEVACVECRDEDDCGGATPWCVDNTCVACTSDEHCASPWAPRCNLETNRCVGCEDVGQCVHLVETPACDVERGRCVECTSEEGDACGERVCNLREEDPGYLTCSEFERESTDQCGECVNDEQCSPGHKCVPELSPHFPDERTGKYHCMLLESELGGGRTCADNAPFMRTISATSEGGVEGRYCTLRTATCTTYLAFGSKPHITPEDQPGAGEPTCISSQSCGFLEAGDGVCNGYCSYNCGTDQDCPPGTGCLGICMPTN
jgi:hypothetical protein